MATDNYSNLQPGLSSPAIDGFAVTPNDSTDLTQTSRALYIGTAGTVVLITSKGTTLNFVGLQAGQTLSVRAARVLSTGTTCTNIIALV